MDDEAAALRRSVRLLRLTVGVLVLAVAVALVAAFDPLHDRPAALEIVDVAALAATRLAAEGPDANAAEFLFAAAGLSAHVHRMGRGELCPLHVHPRGVEITAIARGVADVRTVGRGGARTDALGVGGLFAVPPGVGHRVREATGTAPLASVVLSLPAFDHNVYVEDEADARLAEGTALVLSPAALAEALAGAADAPRTVALGGGATLRLLHAGAIDAPEGVVLALRGEGRIAGRRLGAGALAIVRTRVTVETAGPMALVLVPLPR